MQYRVLGPIEVTENGDTFPLGGPKQRLVLANLLIRFGEVVPIDTLIDDVWGAKPPEAVRVSLQSYVSNLRRSLGTERIERRPPGYLLHVDPDEVDALRFQAAVQGAHRVLTDDPTRAAHVLEEALALWRGPPFADLRDEPSLGAEVARLEELRVAALEDRIEADLALGHHAELIGELDLLIAEHPLRERLWSFLMVALYRSGRQSEALATYRRARALLADELGIDPSRDLQRLERRILQQDSTLELRGIPLRGYELIESVGEGRFGVAYRSIQPHVGREVAIKIARKELADEPAFVRRFEAEAQVVAGLEHPHIVPLYDFWREPGAAYLVMRFEPGGSLRDRIQDGALDADQVADILEQVGPALATAHRRGVIHGDVKPENILFDEDGNAYLSDFGIALDVADASEEVDARDGVAYRSPEQIRGEPPSPPSDVYSLGLVVFEMLAGRHPFERCSGQVLAEKHLREPLPSIELLRPDLPAGMDDLLAAATAKDPVDRSSDPTALARAIRGSFGPSAVQTPTSVIDRVPYKGLLAFREADSEDFFGREGFVATLLSRLAEDVAAHRLVGVVGPSGSGKSSIVLAGLVPALRRGDLPGSEGWFFVEMTPGEHPFEELGAALLRTAVDPPPDLQERLERDGQGLVEMCERVLPVDRSELFLVIDQFEELFTLVDEEVRERFLASLTASVLDPLSRVRVVVALRADLYDRPLAYPGFGQLLGARTATVTPLTPSQLARAIEGPAEGVGVAVDSALVANAVADFANRPGALPLLEYALTESFEHRAGRELTLDAYLAIGGLSGALARRAEAMFGGLDGTGRACVRQVLLRLVTVGPDSIVTRRRVLRAELAAVEVQGRSIDSVVDALGSSRLVSFDRDPATRGPTVEVAHEALLRGWDRLAGWLDDARDDLRIQRSLEEDAAKWDVSGRDPSFLLRGSRLEQAGSWKRRTDLVPTQVTDAYVDEGVRELDAERRAEADQRVREVALRRRSVGRLRALVAVLTIGALVAGSLAILAMDRGRRAEREARVATARELAAEAVANIGVDAERSLVLALEAVETTYRVDGTAVPEATEALHLALQADRLLFSVPGYQARYSADGTRLLVVGDEGQQRGGRTAVRVLDGVTGEVLQEASGRGRGDAALGSDGGLFATSDWEGDGHTYLWDTTSGEQLAQLGNVAGLSLRFSPDDRSLAITGSDDDTYVFDLSTGEVRRARGAGPLAFSPDGERLLIGDAHRDGLAAPIVLDLHAPSDGSGVVTLGDRGGGRARDGAWSPDGTSVATLSQTRVTLWNARSGVERFAIAPPSGRFTSVGFGPRSLLATGMGNGTAIVWHLSAGDAEPLLKVGGHAAQVTNVSFDSHGTRLSTASDDGVVKVWDARPEGAREWLTVPGSRAVSFSPDGRSLAVGSDGGAIVIYEATTGDTLVHVAAPAPGDRSGLVNAIAFDPSGAMLASAGSDGTVSLFEAETGSAVWSAPDQPFDSDILDVAVAPDGRSVATAAFANDEPVDLWDAATGTHLRSLPYDGNDANAGHAVAFSRDGRFVAGSGYTFVRVWRLTDETSVQIETGVVNALDISPDGGLLVTGANDGSVRLWDARTGRSMATEFRSLGQVTDVSFSPDGATIATSSSDGTVRLWRGRTLEPLMTIARDAAGISETTNFPEGVVAFSPDGARLAYTAEDGMVRVLVLRVDDLIGLAEARLSRS